MFKYFVLENEAVVAKTVVFPTFCFAEKKFGSIARPWPAV